MDRLKRIIRSRTTLALVWLAYTAFAFVMAFAVSPDVLAVVIYTLSAALGWVLLLVNLMTDYTAWRVED